MKDKFPILILICFIILCLRQGFSTYPIRTFGDGASEYEISSKISQNSLDFSKSQKSTAYNLDSLIKKDGLILTNNQPCRIKYHRLSSTDRNIVVEGKIGIDRNKHPVVLDTGASQPVFINSSLLKKSKLPVYTIEGGNPNVNGYKLGICQLSDLDIGEVTLEDWPCIYLESHIGLNLFGIPIASSTYGKDNIILGLPLLKEFKYIILDNINKEVELSYHQSFDPRFPDQWEKYPISIEEDFHGNTFLFVRLNITDQEIELQLDTGSGRGMAIGERLWEQIKDNLNGVKLKKGKDFYPYIGNLTCRKGKISKLLFGNRTIENVDVSVFKDDSSLLDGCEGLVGMQYFSNTIIVLDFEHDIMWLKE